MPRYYRVPSHQTLLNRKNAVRKNLAENGLSGAFNVYTAESPVCPKDPKAETLLRDIVGGMCRWGKMATPRQIEVLHSLLTAIETAEARWAERRAAYALEAEAAAAAPNGERLTSWFTVISVKESQWGQKMLVKNDHGWRAYGSVPRGYFPQRGARIEMTATFKAKEDDPKFAFYSRPTFSSAAGVATEGGAA